MVIALVIVIAPYHGDPWILILEIEGVSQEQLIEAVWRVPDASPARAP
jgi:hypothetical protein